MFVPAKPFLDFIDAVCAECERHRRANVKLFLLVMIVGVIGIPTGYAEPFATAAGTLSGGIAGIGYLSAWRGWAENERD